MKNKSLLTLYIVCLSPLLSCSQEEAASPEAKENVVVENSEQIEQEPHRYGGWYCPDNLNGFPAVDVADWKSVPVVNGRMATAEERHNGASLIDVDMEKYPNAKPFGMVMPLYKNAKIESRNRPDWVPITSSLT